MQVDVEHITSLFENATEGFIVTNGEGRIILVNPSACRMFNYPSEELIDQKIEFLIPAKYKQSHEKLRDGFYKSPETRVMGHNRDLHGQKKGGLTFPVEVSLSTYTKYDERFVIAFIIDITRRKEIENNVSQQQQQLEMVSNEMKKLNADLEEKVQERTLILKEALQKLELSQIELNHALDKERQLNEIKSRFVSMASHEFRTPLSTVLSSASLLSKYTSADDQDSRTRHIVKIKNSVKHLNDLLEDFLSLGKLEENKVATEISCFNLKQLIEDTIDEMNVVLKQDQQIIFHHAGEEDYFNDKKLIKNILINLLSNAIKFSAEGSDIIVNSAVTKTTGSITVKDKGIGIAKQDIEHLFSSFFRGNNAVNIQGTGLGLHIVKRYLELIDGTIDIQSEIDKGTIINIQVPNKK